jgi:outer membrane receptor protein involved in Fe transport
LSIVDVDAVESIDMRTGGFSAEYGDRMSGVYEIATKRPPVDQKRYSVGLSFMNARFLSEGTFAGNKCSWLVSARRGYLDVILGIMGEGETYRPQYYDLLSKVQYQLGGNHVLSANVLYAKDYLKILDDEDTYGVDTVETSYGNQYGWLTLRSQLHPRLFVQTLVSTGKVKHDRFGYNHSDWFYENGGDGFDARATDKKDFTYYGLKQDWELDISDDYLVKAGYEAKKLNAEYDYLSRDRMRYYDPAGDSNYYYVDSHRQQSDPSGNKYAAYVSNRIRPWAPLTFEVGLRYDRASYTGDEHFSPRLSAVYDLTERTALRAAWGRYYQSERINEMSVQDGETIFLPATLAEHKVVGLEHRFESGIQVRLEGYLKEYSDLQPHYRNYLQDIELFPELEDDRITVMRDGSTSKGIEFYLKKGTGGKFTWWASYAYAKVEDKVSSYTYWNWGLEEEAEVILNSDLPGVNDQRHTVYFDVNYKPSNKWQWNLAWQFHTGWPYTKETFRTDDRDGYTIGWFGPGELHGERHKRFSRVDLRINRYFNIGHGRVTAFLEIVNLLNQKNVRSYEYSVNWANGQWRLDPEPQHWFTILPTVGIAWRLDM